MLVVRNRCDTLLQDEPMADSAPHLLWFASPRNAVRTCDPELPAGEGNVVGEVEGSIRTGIRIVFLGSSGGGIPNSFSMPVNADEIVC